MGELVSLSSSLSTYPKVPFFSLYFYLFSYTSPSSSSIHPLIFHIVSCVCFGVCFICNLIFSVLSFITSLLYLLISWTYLLFYSLPLSSLFSYLLILHGHVFLSSVSNIFACYQPFNLSSNDICFKGSSYYN